jgi:hypothetical protein
LKQSHFAEILCIHTMAACGSRNTQLSFPHACTTNRFSTGDSILDAEDRDAMLLQLE